MLSTLTYFQIFASMFSAAILQFFPGLMSYRVFALIVAVFSVLAIIYELLYRKLHLGKIFFTALIYAVVICLYFLTSAVSVAQEEHYKSFMMVICGQIYPTIICASIIAQSPRDINSIKKYAPLVAVVFTIISLVAVLNPTGKTGGGFISNDNGLNYQTTSYLAAYATGFLLYYIVVYKDIEWPFLFRYKLFVWISALLIVINFLTIILAGGRGGLVLFAILLFVMGVYYFSKRKISLKTQIQIGIVLVVVFVVGKLCVDYAEHSTLEMNGFKRILDLMDSNRDSLREDSFSLFAESPILGHGLGSVFSLLGIYTHNLFTDALVETGVIGTVILLFLIVFAFRQGCRLVAVDKSNLLWLIIFMDGFVLGMFSGYYLAHIPLYWSISFLINGIGEKWYNSPTRIVKYRHV